MGIGNLKSFSGKVANVVGYQLDGRDHVRSKPGSIRQTKATKKSASVFGKASRIGGELRSKLLQVIPYPSDIKMQTRLSSSILKWLRDNGTTNPDAADHLPFVEGFQFTEEGYTLAQRFRVPLEVSNPSDGLVQMSLPAFTPSKSIFAPRGTVSVVCDITAVNCVVATASVAGSASTQLVFDYNDNLSAAQTISLPLPTPAGSLLVTAVSLKYRTADKNGPQQIKAKGYMPAAIVSAMYL